MKKGAEVYALNRVHISLNRGLLNRDSVYVFVFNFRVITVKNSSHPVLLSVFSH